MTQTTPAPSGFSELKLPESLLRALDTLGYDTPTDIQTSTIPPLLEGRDVLGHAPTGTGKTAAFALPVLARLKPGKNGVQALVLAPTRELAIQVAEAFTQYAVNSPKVRVLPVYGGQEYGRQTNQLKKGVDIVVGTPGRIMDHMRRGNLDLSKLDTLVLDEADEMLRMGFIDDVKWVLEQTPANRRMALFSATMPKEVRRIANSYMKNPAEVSIAKRTQTAATIRQRYWSVSGFHKLDTMARILEAEVFDGMIIFVRTKNATSEVAERLQELGYRAAAMNGDMAQKQREQTVGMLKSKRLDILVATDVVARGLDVDRISHVVNYDVPFDAEAYIHRIGRTGRAGRKGDAILFITPREQRMLQILERASGQKIEKLALPTTKMINERRIADFKQRVLDTIGSAELNYLQQLVEEMVHEHKLPASQVAAALAKQMLGDGELLLDESRDSVRHKKTRDKKSKDKTFRDTESSRGGRSRSDKHEPRTVERSADEKRARRSFAEDNGIEMERFRVEVGASHGMQASNLVGAIANEAGLDSQFIGRIKIADEHSTVELPTGMPKAVLKDLRGVWVCSRKLNMSRDSDKQTEHSADGSEQAPKKAKRYDKPRHKKKKTSNKKNRAAATGRTGGAKSAERSGKNKPPKKHKKRNDARAA